MILYLFLFWLVGFFFFFLWKAVESSRPFSLGFYYLRECWEGGIIGWPCQKKIGISSFNLFLKKKTYSEEGWNFFSNYRLVLSEYKIYSLEPLDFVKNVWISIDDIIVCWILHFIIRPLYLLMYNRWRKQFLSFFLSSSSSWPHRALRSLSKSENIQWRRRRFRFAFGAMVCGHVETRKSHSHERDGSTANTFETKI